MQVKKALKATTTAEIKEDYRKNLYNAMRGGMHAVFFFDKIVPNFNSEYFDEKTTPECIFKPSDFEQESVYK